MYLNYNNIRINRHMVIASFLVSIPFTLEESATGAVSIHVLLVGSKLGCVEVPQADAEMGREMRAPYLLFCANLGSDFNCFLCYGLVRLY